MKKPSYTALKREVAQQDDRIEQLVRDSNYLGGQARQAIADKEAAVKQAQEKAGQLAQLEAQVSVAHHLLDGLGAPREAHGVKLDLVQRIAAIR